MCLRNLLDETDNYCLEQVARQTGGGGGVEQEDTISPTPPMLSSLFKKTVVLSLYILSFVCNGQIM